LNLEVFTCRICSEAGRRDYDFCRNCVPLGRHCSHCIVRGCCSPSASVRISELTLRDELTPRALDKNATQAPGFVLIIVGMFPLILGVIGSSMTTCPPTGCPPSVISRLGWQNTSLFFSGIVLVALGIISLLKARRARLTYVANSASTKVANDKKIVTTLSQISSSQFRLPLTRSLWR
jgi:hypothetical protein